MANQHYVLTTKSARCLNQVLQSGRFDHVRRNQPKSGAFLDALIGAAPDQRPSVEFAFFDRVRTSDTYRCLTGIYQLVDIRVDTEAAPYKGKFEQYSLYLRRTSDFSPPIPFEPETALWERLECTQGQGMLQFFAGPCVLFPISALDFQAIQEFSSKYAEAGSKDEPLPETAGILLAERELQDYLSENLELLEPGLQPFDPDRPAEFPTGDGGRIDLLCRDKDGGIVVVELKKGKADDVVVGQLARYMGWAKEKLANGGRVRGVIIANVISDRLRYAAKAIPDIRLVAYQVEFKLRPVE